jgi:hypothetical protein
MEFATSAEVMVLAVRFGGLDGNVVFLLLNAGDRVVAPGSPNLNRNGHLLDYDHDNKAAFSVSILSLYMDAQLFAKIV